MRSIDVAGISESPEKRFDFLCQFVGFTDQDWAALKDSVDVLGPRLPGLLDALYEHLLGFDDTKRLFLGERGEVDPRYLAVRKEHLTEWVLKTVEGNDPKGFVKYLVSTGRRHTGVAGEPNRVVPPRYMVALTAFIQTALWSTLFDAIPDRPKDIQRMGVAWNKMLMIQLEVFLKVMTPHWPHWDETPGATHKT